MKVIKASIDNIQEAVDFAYPYQVKISTRCRPLSINCKREELETLFESYVEREMHELLILKQDEKIVGVTPVYWMADDRYVSYSQGPYCLEYEKGSSAFLKYIVESFKGYKFYINTAKEHKLSNDFFMSNQFDKLEDAKLLELEQFCKLNESLHTKLLDEKNSDALFHSIDNSIDEDTYWNSSRIKTALDNFIIIGYFDTDIKGFIIGRKGKNKSIEVINFNGDEFAKEELLKAFINQVQKDKLSRIELYTEEVFEIDLGKNYDFKEYDSNICYIKYL
ncbi:MAG: hypothetical protein ACVCEJ_11295 [Candidatus Izemoplasmataceae bacterium]